MVNFALIFYGKLVGAHCLAWEIWNGQKIPDGMKVLHSCDNPGCCNPKHLRLGSQQENISDILLRGDFRGRKRIKAAKPNVD